MSACYCDASFFFTGCDESACFALAVFTVVVNGLGMVAVGSELGYQLARLQAKQTRNRWLLRVFYSLLLIAGSQLEGAACF